MIKNKTVEKTKKETFIYNLINENEKKFLHFWKYDKRIALFLTEKQLWKDIRQEFYLSLLQALKDYKIKNERSLKRKEKEFYQYLKKLWHYRLRKFLRAFGFISNEKREFLFTELDLN